MDKPYDIPEFLKDTHVQEGLAAVDVCSFCWCRISYAGANINPWEFVCRCGDEEEDCYD